MRKILVSWLAALTIVLNAAGQEQTNYHSAEEIQREVALLLFNRNINEVTSQLDSETPATTNSLLRRLLIYGRAGQTSRVHKTLEQFPLIADWQCQAAYDVKRLIQNADKSLEAQRFYYEKICPNDSDGADEFVHLWSAEGNAKELDQWLGERANRNDVWLLLRVQLRARSGTAGELLDGLAAEIRANPSDWKRLERYLAANNYVGNKLDPAWLADTFEVHTAADCFQLGQALRTLSLQAGATLLQRSLELSFTEADARFVENLIFRHLSVGPSIRINYEKQLRYWTKRSLAETYQRLNQSLAAQPLVAELVATKADDILLEDVHVLAGAVQAGSGQRVVETKIVADEAARRSTSEYWLERARYYDGRGEYGIQRDSYRRALIALTAKRDDSKALYERFNVVTSFAFFLGDEHNGEEDKPELEKLLRRELSSTPPETDYTFRIAGLIIQNELGLDELRDSLLTKRPSFLARLLNGRREWGNDEGYFIEKVVNREGVPSSLKDKIWSSLESLVRDPGSTRAYFLAEAMNESHEWQRAIPLLRGYIEHASPKNWEGYKSSAITDLFTAYCRTKQWQAAEKLLLAQQDVCWRNLPNALAEVAVVAAQQNAVEDAMRLWRMSTNLDRRNLEPLSQLAQTKARPQLLAMYSQMKKEDPLSNIPDLALKLLQ